MNPQSVKAKLLAGSLFALSTGGTIALFGAVPVVAKILSVHSSPSQSLSQSQILAHRIDDQIDQLQTLHSAVLDRGY